MGGFFGITSKRDCLLDVFFGVDYHSHLGTRRAGIATFDKESLKKLFSIIMDNAIKYTDKNGSITVSLFSDKNKVKMIIRNTK